MKFEGIKTKIRDLIGDRYTFDNNVELIKELMDFSDEKLKYKEIVRIKRLSSEFYGWKTLAFVEIEADRESEIKNELKNALSWIASVKENLLEPESTDLYLFLAFNADISNEECLRLESTEQFCRKYVLLQDETIPAFFNRTFLQELLSSNDTTEGTDPLERAFANTLTEFSWLTPEVQKIWKKAFTELSGMDLLEKIFEGQA